MIQREQMLSPQFKEAAEQDYSRQELRKFSSVSAMEVNTPETKYRSTITPHKFDNSKDMNSLHYRNKTCDEDQLKLYDEIRELFARREFDQPQYVEPKILFQAEYPKKITIRRQATQIASPNNLLIEKMYKANQMSLLSLF